MNNTRVLLSIICSLIPFAPALGEVPGDAKRAYNAREYNKAAAIFEAQIRKTPRDAMLHYYYANCLVGKHDNSEAASEYALASQLFTDQKMKDYCLNLADHFSYHVPEDPHSRLGAPNIPDKILNSYRTDDPTKNTKIQQILRRGEDDANRRLNSAERQIAPLNREKSELQSQTVLTKMTIANPGNDDTLDAQMRLDERAQSLRDLAQRQAKQIREQAKRDAERVAR